MTGSEGINEGPFHRTFRLSITKALGDQLAEELKRLKPEPFTLESIAQVGGRSGVYQLYLDGAFIYVGKARSDLRNRLTQHHTKISGRRNIDLETMTFSCLYVLEDFTALAPEQLLIDQFRRGGGIPWNVSGFGNKDPGRNRDRSMVKEKHFDALHPINLDYPLGELPVGLTKFSIYMAVLKRELPFNFRYDKKNAPKLGLVEVPADVGTADEAFRMLGAALPSEWQIVALPGYVIAYPDAGAEYDSALRYYASGGGVTEHAPRFDPTPVKVEKGPLADDGDEEDEGE